jgi:hypothetical protein
MGRDEIQYFLMIHERHRRQRVKQAHHLCSPGQVAAGQFANYERMNMDLRCLEQIRQPNVPSAEMVYPDGCIDKHAALFGNTPTPSRNDSKLAFAATERRQTSGTLARNQCLEASMHNGCFLPKSAEFSGFTEQFIIDDQCGSHMQQYGYLMHISQCTRHSRLMDLVPQGLGLAVVKTGVTERSLKATAVLGKQTAAGHFETFNEARCLP